MFRLAFVLIGALALSAQGRTRFVAPLMPPRDKASMIAPTQRLQTTKKKTRLERSGLAFEAGVLGIGTSSASDVAGLQLLYGLRASGILPLGNRFFIKPSLGYFFKPESEGSVSIFQNVIEGGMGAHYSLLLRSGWMWHVGISQRLDYLFSRISIQDSAANTPASFRYRVGPSTGVRIKLNATTDFTFDLEGGVAPFENLRTQTSFTSGLVFFLD